MLLKDSLYGLTVKCSLIPETIGFLLYFLGIEVCQHVFHLRNRLLATTVAKHF